MKPRNILLGVDAAELAGARAAQMLLCGPAGGLAGARFVGRSARRKKLLTFDMGSTSTDIDPAFRTAPCGLPDRKSCAWKQIDLMSGHGTKVLTGT